MRQCRSLDNDVHCLLQVSRHQCLQRGHQRAGRQHVKSLFFGQQLAVKQTTCSKWRMGQWLENKASVECAVPLETCWSLWEDRERIPQWMPWIKSVKVLESDQRLSRWTLATHQFGRDWEFSWLARNLAPIKNQKIHWVSEPRSTSVQGLELNNKGQIRFVRKPQNGCSVTLSIQYEVPDVLIPFANALAPIVNGIIQRDMEKFKELAKEYALTKLEA